MSGNGDALGSDAEFEEFENSGGVEGSFAEAGDDKADDKAKKPAAKGKAAAGNVKNVGDGVEATGDYARGAEEEEDDTGEEGDDTGEEGDDKKPKKTPAEHQIDRLKREKRDLNRRLRELEGGAGTSALAARLAAVESRLTGESGGDTKSGGATPAPDPSDTEKYPLGHLDDRYIEDKLEWLAEQKANKLAETGRQRQSEDEQQRQIQQAQTELLGKVDTLAEKGEALFDDFQETVVEAGMRGDWKLTQTTFEAAHDAENGAQILYDLANDPKEAARVANLSPLKQLQFVLERDAEISAKAKPRTKPKAGDPPKHQARGANSRTQSNPATNDLEDFEKQWKREEASKR